MNNNTVDHILWPYEPDEEPHDYADDYDDNASQIKLDKDENKTD